jgi:hypothetical protein
MSSNAGLLACTGERSSPEDQGTWRLRAAHTSNAGLLACTGEQSSPALNTARFLPEPLQLVSDSSVGLLACTGERSSPHASSLPSPYPVTHAS